MQSSLNGRVCLVTGGTQGLGWAVSQALADAGATVHACGRSEASLAAAGRELAAGPWREAIHLHQCDVTQQVAISSWIEAVLRQHGRVDVLVNNAAFVRWADVTEMTLDDEIQSMRVGFEGMIHTTRAVMPFMLAASSGHIVNISSIAGRIFVGGASAAYSAAKAAVDAYTRTLQAELDGTGITATIVRLGTISGTDFFKKHVPRERMPAFTRLVPAFTPPQAASRIVSAIEQRRKVVTLPRFLTLLTWFYELAPGLARRVAWLGGINPRDYGQVAWRYDRSQ